jgi:S1-C subfamily serine protease
MDVAAHGPAGVAGLQGGDILVSFGGVAITSIDALHRVLNAEAIGVGTELGIVRRDRLVALRIVPTELLA